MWGHVISKLAPLLLFTAAISVIASPVFALSTDETPSITRTPEKEEHFTLGSKSLTIDFNIEGELKKALEILADSKASKASKPTIRLRINGLRPSKTTWAKGGRVFLNLPKTDDESNPDILCSSSPYFVGSFSFFPSDSGEQSFYLSPGPTLLRLAERHELDDLHTLRITLVGIPKGDHDGSKKPLDDTEFLSYTMEVVPPASNK